MLMLPCPLTHATSSATYNGIGGKRTSRIWKRSASHHQVSLCLASEFGLEGLASDCNLVIYSQGNLSFEGQTVFFLDVYILA
jgi:hypothetical protein